MIQEEQTFSGVENYCNDQSNWKSSRLKKKKFQNA